MVRIHRQNTHRAFLFLPHQFPTPERHSTPHRHTHAMEPQSNINNFFWVTGEQFARFICFYIG